MELAIEDVMSAVTKTSAVATTQAIWEFDPESPSSLLDNGKADAVSMFRTVSVKVCNF